MSEFEVKVARVVSAWIDKPEDEICQQVRVAWVMEQWPELGEALQELAKVDYEPLLTEAEMSKHVKAVAENMVSQVYTEEHTIKEIEQTNKHHDVMADLANINKVLDSSG